MPAISRIRFTNVIYENGGKRYNDMIFRFDGQNAAILLENGGGKTVLIQTAMQAIIPHTDIADRKMKDTLSLENGPAHIAIEWILNDHPRRYAVTATSLYLENNALQSLKYAYEYPADDANGIEKIPFTIKNNNGSQRPASKGEISEYYYRMRKNDFNAKVFDSIKGFGQYIENNYKIIPAEWKRIGVINSGEGNVDEFFSKCKTTTQLVNRLLIPIVEEAMDGDHTNQFVETFEKQREHFKKNKALQDKILQSQLAMEKIEGYVEEYGAYDQVSKQYEEEKKDAHILYREVKNKLKLLSEQAQLNKDKVLSLHKEQSELDRKNLSYKILCVENRENILKEEKEVLRGQFKKKQESLETLQARKQNIELTILQDNILENEQYIKSLEVKLKEIDKNLGIEDLQGKLNENNRHLKAYFTQHLEKINERMGQVDERMTAHDMKATNLRKNQLALKDKEKVAIEELTKIRTEIELKEKSLDEFMTQLFDHEVRQEVKVYHQELVNQKKALEDQIISEEKSLKDLETGLEELTEEDRINTDALMNKRFEYGLKKKELDDLEGLQRQLIQELELHRIYVPTTIYDKEESITSGIIEKAEKAIIEKEKALLNERNSKRIYDLYESSKAFSADPLLEKTIAGLENSVSFICLGTKYIQTIIESKDIREEDLFEKYPLWPITIITTEDDKKKVENAIRNSSKSFMHPIIVLSTEEVNQIIANEKSFVDGITGIKIYPKHWLQNLTELGFEQFREEAKHLGLKAEEKRKEAEEGVNAILEVQSKVKGYFKDHPFIKYNYLNDEVNELKDEIEKRNERKVFLQKELEKSSGYIEIVKSKIEKYENELDIIDGKVACSKTCLIIEEEIKNYHIVRKDKEDNFTAVKHEREKNEQGIEDCHALLKELSVEKNQLKIEVSKVEENEIYKDVKDSKKISGVSPEDLNYEVLKKIRLDLLNEINGFGAERIPVEAELSREKADLSRNQKEKRLKEKQGKFVVVRVEDFYDNELDDLIDKIGKLEPKCGDLHKELNSKETELAKCEGQKSIHKNELDAKYTHIYVFDQSLDKIESSLAEEKSRLKKKDRELKKEGNQIEASMHFFNEIERDLSINDGKYGFTLVDIEGIVIGEREGDLSKEYIAHTLSKLSNGKKTLLSKQEHIDETREKVIDYCKANIEDYKIREAALTGIQKKKSYKDLVAYREGMEERIHKTIRLLEDDRRESDAELQTFLTHLHAYIKNIAIELEMIQRKTSIKVDDSYKQIFIFDIPVWEEAEGKEALRKYIDLIVGYFDKESERFENNEVELKKEIENRLSVQNLLQVVMGDQTIKIKCRKVTNDMKINKAPTSWESSNRWSGGEKWSKNMTLFLSILNYLAGKKQHLNSQQQNNRTVILDNPFGKASSNHVLNPVFKIGEKLGFQIIALTAHAEGKFISDYFPVVYSCRLRKTRDGDRQIMTTEKQINVAYLREHSPKSIVALQEVEQLSLI